MKFGRFQGRERETGINTRGRGVEFTKREKQREKEERK
jgi:hypothetical protein